jgi:hypothetical protein
VHTHPCHAPVTIRLIYETFLLISSVILSSLELSLAIFILDRVIRNHWYLIILIYKNENPIGFISILAVNHQLIRYTGNLYNLTIFGQTGVRDSRNPVEAGVCLPSLPQPKAKQNILRDFSQFYIKIDAQSVLINSNNNTRHSDFALDFNERGKMCLSCSSTDTH